MYEKFYGLDRRAFAIVPDPTFLYWTSPHRLAFAMLEYGIVNHAGFTVITGEIGAGKTTLLRQLLSKLPGDINVGLLSNMQGGRGELLEWVLMAFEQEFEGMSYVSLHRRFQQFLLQQQEAGKRTVLIIDEAQNLGADTLEQLRMISNVNTYDRDLLQIVLCGQPQLKDLLAAPELSQFVQRIASDFHLNLLNRNEVTGYINHRLRVAGAARQIFTESAHELIAYATSGTPRLINILCDTALLYGYAVDAEMITTEIVQKVLEDKAQHGVFSMTQITRGQGRSSSTA